MAWAASGSSPKHRTPRSYALEQVGALRADLPSSIWGAGPAAGAGDNLDVSLQSKLSSMTEQVGGLLRRTRPDSPEARALEPYGGYPPTASSPSAPRGASAPRRRAPSPRQPRPVAAFSDDYGDGQDAKGLLEKIFQDVESQRITVGDALGSLEVGISSLGLSFASTRPSTAALAASRQATVSLADTSGRSCLRCNVLVQQVQAIAQSLVGLSARLMGWMETSGLDGSKRTLLEDMILEYCRPCAHVEPGVAALVGELLEATGKRRGGASSSPEARFGAGGSPPPTPQRPRFGADLGRPLPTFGTAGSPGGRQQAQLGLEAEMWSKAESFLQRHDFKSVNDRKNTKRGGITSGWTTPLHIATEKADADAVEALLWCGASADEANSQGQVPLVIAHKVNRDQSHAAVIELLQEAMEASQ